jgi:hypothetical protein
MRHAAPGEAHGAGDLALGGDERARDGRVAHDARADQADAVAGADVPAAA